MAYGWQMAHNFWARFWFRPLTNYIALIKTSRKWVRVICQSGFNEKFVSVTFWESIPLPITVYHNYSETCQLCDAIERPRDLLSTVCYRRHKPCLRTRTLSTLVGGCFKRVPLIVEQGKAINFSKRPALICFVLYGVFWVTFNDGRVLICVKCQRVAVSFYNRRGLTFDRWQLQLKGKYDKSLLFISFCCLRKYLNI